MPVKSYQEDLLKRLSNKEYASEYLKVSFEETINDGNKDAFLLALKNVVEAKPEEIKQTEGLLKNKMAEAGIDKDAEIVKLAEEVLKTLQKEDEEGLATGKYGIKVQGDIKGIVGDIS